MNVVVQQEWREHSPENETYEQVGTDSENFLLRTNPFDNLERLASAISARENGNTAARQVNQENQQRKRRYELMHSSAMAKFARCEIQLGKMRQR